MMNARKIFAPAMHVAFGKQRSVLLALPFTRSLSTAKDEQLDETTHFRISNTRHPLLIKKKTYSDLQYGDKTGRQQNHIWTKDEIKEKMETLYRHIPDTLSDHVMNKIMYALYNVFNFITRYDEKNPTVKSIEWRLIVLESVAGVPGFIGAAVRHFQSLRLLKRDHGWIATLLEEAENERMHLLVCLTKFKASYLTRFLVVSAQAIMTPSLFALYLVHPKACHRFVGYLEETACHTYVNVIKKIDEPGSHLNTGWSNLKAPDLAIAYWKLDPDASWKDTLGCMMADETHHRDVNHTFAAMNSDDPNPFLAMHKENAAHAWRMKDSKVTTETP